MGRRRVGIRQRMSVDVKHPGSPGASTTDALRQDAELTALFDRGDDAGCLELSEISDLIKSSDLSEADVEALYQEIGARGITISDDCSREGAPEATYDNESLAGVTMDALRLFL